VNWTIKKAIGTDRKPEGKVLVVGGCVGEYMIEWWTQVPLDYFILEDTPKQIKSNNFIIF